MIVITTYRNREDHLKQWLGFYDQYRKAVESNLTVIVVEQLNTRPFNRGLLFNVAFDVLGIKDQNPIALCDVDMIPDTILDYRKVNNPTLLATNVSQFGNEMPYENYFSGHILVSAEMYIAANGFPNTFWGWGGEDDEFRRRLIVKGYDIEKRPHKFKSLPHERKIVKHLHQRNVRKLLTPIRWIDGLSSVKKHYKLVSSDWNDSVLHIKIK